jgi:lipopolysaccharide export system protein LptA
MKLFRLSMMLVLIASGHLVTGEPAERTVIRSTSMEMQGSESNNYFHFRGQVEATGTNLRIRCDALTIVSRRGGDSPTGIGEIGAIESIVALGNVVIEQAGRTAYAGRAEVNPATGTVTLSDNPRITDRGVEVEGYQFVLNQGKRSFVSLPDPAATGGSAGRSVVRLGALPDLGFDQDDATLRAGVEPTDEPEGEPPPSTAPDNAPAPARQPQP